MSQKPTDNPEVLEIIDIEEFAKSGRRSLLLDRSDFAWTGPTTKLVNRRLRAAKSSSLRQDTRGIHPVAEVSWGTGEEQ